MTGTGRHAGFAREGSGRPRRRGPFTCGLVALLVVAGQAGSAAGAAPSAHVGISPLAASGYSVEPVCGPVSEGARCQSLRIVPKGSNAAPKSAAGAPGLTPIELHEAYEKTDIAPAEDPQTIAIVAAFDDPTALKDLKTYSKEFNLPQCTGAKHCFEKVNQRGESNSPPPPNGGWAEEISIDIEAAHAICKNCHILLVEAESEKLPDLEAAEDEAAAMGATEISNSFAFPEPTADSPAFDHKGIVITAASGDEGYLNWTGEEKEEGHADYPASSPHVVAVGGTRLTRSEGKWSEEVWNGELPGGHGEPGAAGSGCSDRFPAPYWQLELPDWSALGCHSTRAVADISADADPLTGMEIYDSTPNEEGHVPGWQMMGGTSLSAPLIAAMFAVAGGSGGVEYPARTLYENAVLKPASLYDVESGSNGSCHGALTGGGNAGCSVAEEGIICAESPICVAGRGFDGPSGLGSPRGDGVFEPTGAPAKQTQTVAFTSVAPAGARVGDAPYLPTASSSSGLPVGFSSQTPSVCALEGGRVGFLSPGTCTVEAHQPGKGAYGPAAPAEQSFTVAKGLQTITFTSTPPASATAGGSGYAVSASASSGLPVALSSDTTAVCSLEGATVRYNSEGTCTITAGQAGSSLYEPAPAAQQSFAVAAAPELVQSIPGDSPETKSPTASETLSFASTNTPSVSPDNRFELLGAPRLGAHSGAVTFSVHLADAGILAWKLTFRTRSHGARSGIFATGQLTVKTAGTVSFTARPRALASAALHSAAAAKKRLPLRATISFHSALGGTPTSQVVALSDRVR